MISHDRMNNANPLENVTAAFETKKEAGSLMGLQRPWEQPEVQEEVMTKKPATRPPARKRLSSLILIHRKK